MADRAPVSVTAVLDRSGSMSGSKIQLLKRSTEFLVEKLQGSDSLGVVSYSSDVRKHALYSWNLNSIECPHNHVP